MRHRVSGNRLSRNQSLRKATLRDMARAVLVQERICTTRAKAKEARKLVEKLITLGKKDTLPARRKAFSILCDHVLVSRLFKETAPRFKSRAGGYTRVIPFVKRDGDNAALAFLELTEKSRAIITGQKKTKGGAADTPVVSEAQTIPAPPKAGPSESPKAPVAEGHSKADIKSSAAKTAPKPAGIRKFFQRKTGGE
ncbi:MAG: 50S ribosomal protein L17 [Candidatus Omnitrophica bacterium]|nr:50S ribosomal protein L17 [Candidatus Omnitrophota bacterium]